MRTVLVYSPYQFPPCVAFAAGIQACGDRVIWRNSSSYKFDCYEKCDVAVVFGLKDPMSLVLSDQQRHGTPTVVIDLGFVKRGNLIKTREHPHEVYWSAGIGGLNGAADFRNHLMPGDRWRALGVELQPWREGGDFVLVCGQKPQDAQLYGIEPRAWASEIIENIRTFTDRAILFRRHPEDPILRPLPGVTNSVASTLAEDLRDAYCVVAFNSNALVDAVIAGVPAFALGHSAMAEAVSSRSLAQLDEPAKPDRQQFFNDLSYCQWTLPEMAAGKPWRHLIYRETASIEEPATEDESPHLFQREELRQDTARHASGRGRPKKTRLADGDAGESQLPAE